MSTPGVGRSSDSRLCGGAARQFELHEHPMLAVFRGNLASVVGRPVQETERAVQRMGFRHETRAVETQDGVVRLPDTSDGSVH